MTEQESGPTTGGLQPLEFQPIQVEGPVTIFRALVEDKSAPRSPVFALTVTIDSAAVKEYEKEFREFLGEMRAAFRLLPEPDPSESEPSYDEPFDISTQIQIEADLVRLEGEGPADVAVTVETATGTDLAGEPATRGLADFRINPHGKDHHWKTRHGFRTGTVTPRQGQGAISAPRTPVSVGHRGQLYAKEITVHSDKGMKYDFDGRFIGP